jgi:hypothetical protein
MAIAFLKNHCFCATNISTITQVIQPNRQNIACRISYSGGYIVIASKVFKHRMNAGIMYFGVHLNKGYD